MSADLNARKDSSRRDISDAALGPAVALRHSPSACSDGIKKKRCALGPSSPHPWPCKRDQLPWADNPSHKGVKMADRADSGIGPRQQDGACEPWPRRMPRGVPAREGWRLRASGRCADGGVASDGVRWRRREQAALEACPVRSNDPLPVDRRCQKLNFQRVGCQSHRNSRGPQTDGWRDGDGGSPTAAWPERASIFNNPFGGMPTANAEGHEGPQGSI